MELERPGEERKNRLEANAEVKSGRGSSPESPSSSEEERKSSVAAPAAAVVVVEKVRDLERWSEEAQQELASYKELKFLKIDGLLLPPASEKRGSWSSSSMAGGGGEKAIEGKHLNLEKQRWLIGTS
ncbi:non-structural protein 1 [Striga asiatica]|uniref:Non-structural protein 1 n=1 Tax=Striga asiatica TaxID=4170 RepID=A0A5A7QH62_STRAF|nr:non-structural protein 1 [Striga asiatica]